VKETWALLRRDVMLAWREGGTIGTALGFYLVVVAITPLGLGPDLNLLSRIAPGVLWVALLLAGLLSADRIFHNDYEDGALDVLATGPLPLELVAGVKSLAHWVTTGIPLALLAPLLGLLLNLPIDRIDDVVRPAGSQKDALDALSVDTKKALEVLAGACPDEIPQTPVGRLEAMGFDLHLLIPGYYERKLGRQLQVDGVFYRAQGAAAPAGMGDSF